MKKTPGETVLTSEKQSVNEQISFIIKDYLSHRSHVTINSLANKCGLAESTLRRMAQNKAKTVPEAANIVSLLFYIYQVNQMQALLPKLTGSIKEYLIKEYEFLLSMPLKTSPTEGPALQNKELLRDKYKYLVFTMASHRSGVTRSEVSQLLGEMGLKSLEILVSHQIIIEREKVFYIQNAQFKPEASQFIENLKALAELIDINTNQKSNSHKNLFVLGNESISEEVYLEILHIQREALLKIRNLVEKPQSNGPIHFFMLSAIDQMIAKKSV